MEMLYVFLQSLNLASWAIDGLVLLIQALLVLVPLLVSVAYLTLAERKVLGYLQLRPGPSTVGWFGLLQPFHSSFAYCSCHFFNLDLEYLEIIEERMQ